MAEQAGQDTALDECGGHSHTNWEIYHYHSEVILDLSTNELDGVGRGSGPFTYTAYNLAPTNCWKGNVDVIPNFWQSNGTTSLHSS